MLKHLIVAIAIGATGASLSAQARWTVDAKPILDMKGVDDAGKVIFGTASWATRLKNGTVVIADASGPTVHFIDAQGKLIKSTGRSGQGPGDFRTVTWVGQCGEGGVYVWDFAQTRITTYDESGTMKTSFPFGARGGAQTFTSCNSHGQLFAFGNFRRIQDHGPPPTTPPPYWFINSAAVPLVMSAGGDTVAKFGEVPMSQIVSGAINGRVGGMPRPLGATTSFAVSERNVFLVSSDSAAIGVYGMDGKRSGSIALRVSSRPSTAEHYEKSAEVQLAKYPSSMRDAARKWVLAVPRPDRLPSVSGLRADPSGMVWAVVSVVGDGDTTLRGFSADGRSSVDVTIPANLNVFEIGTDYILGAREDADGEPRITIYKLTRPTRP